MNLPHYLLFQSMLAEVEAIVEEMEIREVVDATVMQVGKGKAQTEQQKKTKSSRHTGNDKKDGTSFNLASTVILNLPDSDETVKTCVTQMGQ